MIGKPCRFRIQVYIALRVFHKGHWPILRTAILKYLVRVDLWLFPPLAFIACYKAISQIVPAQHPMAFVTIMATSFMGATLTLFLLRPPKKKSAHWINKTSN